ncbi:hypothetical protein Kisp02_52970 [Kineosporia sp. NBRC 101731]|nr:hypothetical protein Kisp02_52970 [Kineosporia sp. NBRC 101731]
MRLPAAHVGQATAWTSVRVLPPSVALMVTGANVGDGGVLVEVVRSGAAVLGAPAVVVDEAAGWVVDAEGAGGVLAAARDVPAALAASAASVARVASVVCVIAAGTLGSFVGACALTAEGVAGGDPASASTGGRNGTASAARPPDRPMRLISQTGRPEGHNEVVGEATRERREVALMPAAVR